MRGFLRPCGALPAALLVLAGTLAAARPAVALGSYDSDLETGSAIAMAAFGGVCFIPTAFALMDTPRTTQRLVGRSLVLAGSLASIAFSVWYFADEDPRWYPHAFGWGIGGGVVLAGFIVWLTDDEEDPEAVEGEEPSGAEAGTGPAEAGDAAGSGGEPVEGEAEVGLLPLALPGGGGLLVAGRW